MGDIKFMLIALVVVFLAERFDCLMWRISQRRKVFTYPVTEERWVGAEEDDTCAEDLGKLVQKRLQR